MNQSTMETIENIYITNVVASPLGGFILTLLLLSLLLMLMLLLPCLANGKRLLPGPPAWPVVGHLHLLEKNRPLHQTLYRLAQRYGNIMFLRFGSRPVLVISASELAREFLVTNDRIFASRPRFSAAKHLGYNYTSLGFDPYDRRCRNIRRICTSEILSPSKVQSLSHVVSDEVSKLVRSLLDKTLQNHETLSAVAPSLVNLTFNIIMRVLTNENYYGNTEEEVCKFKEMIKENSVLFGSFNLGDYIPWLKWLECLQGNQRAMKNLRRRRDEFLQRLIDSHRLMNKDSVKENRKFLDILISLVDRGEDYCDNDTIVKGTAWSLLIGMTNTTADTLEWALACLLNYPNAFRKAQQELDDIVGRDRVVEESDLPRLRYIEAIIKETLRLYPGGPLMIPHFSTEPCTVGGYYIPAGTRLLVNLWAIHRDPNKWERPLEFEPERFLENPHLYPADVIGIEDFKYIPFGCGRRACPGSRLGMSVLRLALGRLLQSFDWSVPNGVSMTEGLGITLPRAAPLKAILKPRLPPHLY